MKAKRKERAITLNPPEIFLSQMNGKILTKGQTTISADQKHVGSTLYALQNQTIKTKCFKWISISPTKN